MTTAKWNKKYAALHKEWKQSVVDKAQRVDPSSEYIWEGVAVGWAIGKGLSPKEAHEFAEQAEL
jgi:hypothetical protein